MARRTGILCFPWHIRILYWRPVGFRTLCSPSSGVVVPLPLSIAHEKQLTKTVLCLCIPLLGRFPIPECGLMAVLGNTAADVIQVPQILLCQCVAQPSRLPEPEHGLPRVFRKLSPGKVHAPDIQLRQCVSMVGGFFIPERSLVAGLRDTMAVFMHAAEIELGFRMLLFGQGSPLPQGPRSVEALLGGGDWQNGIFPLNSCQVGLHGISLIPRGGIGDVWRFWQC